PSTAMLSDFSDSPSSRPCASSDTGWRWLSCSETPGHEQCYFGFLQVRGGNPMRRLIFVLSISLVASAGLAEPTNDMPARTELHAIETLTLSDVQFLTGDANARSAVTTGVMRIPRGEGRLPVVVLQHGSGGMAANIEMWSRELNSIGVSTLALDGF